jgi:hypothetical protein
VPAPQRPISPLIFAELFEAGEGDEFLERLIAYPGDLKPLLPLVERWKRDPRPWARRTRLAFALDSRPGRQHRPAFKRLFKQAWHARDHELMGAFMARLDRSLRRRRAKQYRYVNRTIETTETLRLAPSGRRSIFSTPTTHYLRRRAWRYFRRLGFREPAAYVPAVAAALVRYTDDDVRSGENLLDNWGLMHACFGRSDVLAFTARHTNVRAGRGLGEMQAAPMFERHWAVPTAAPALLGLVLDAGCRPVRVWAIQLLKRHHAAALAAVEADMMLRLIDHADADVAAFAAELLADATAAASLPVTTWLRLLATRNATVVQAVVDAFRRHVRFDRVTLAQAVELATHTATPVARLGLEILEGRTVRTDADRETIAGLAAARSSAAGEAVARFALRHLNAAGAYRVERVVAFFDSAVQAVRAGASAALDDDSPAAADPAFWAALLESPYDDVRAFLVERLKHRETLPGAGADALAHLWRTVLLNVHRGGRAKLSALKQVSDRVAREPAGAAALLPVLAVAIRSVRSPEARHGLAAIVAAVEREPALAADVARYLPELQFDEAGACR